jgi:nitroreductase
MLTSRPPDIVRVLREAALAARMAPSIHNTQPWRFRLSHDALEISSDPSRQLKVLDPTGRQQQISIGCALFNARVALAAAGCSVTVQRQPDPDRPRLTARITSDANAAVDPSIAMLEPQIIRRQTNRRRFERLDVPDQLLERLTASARAEGATLTPITDPRQRAVAVQLWQQADHEQLMDAAYRAELRAWTTSDPDRRDGVAARVVPHVDAGSGDELPIRDFDSEGLGWLPTETRSTAAQCLLMLSTADDQASDWLRVGEALERVWLEITGAGFVASLFTQAIEVPEIRAQVREQLHMPSYPHVLLRVGRAPQTPSTSRRPLCEMVQTTTSIAVLPDTDGPNVLSSTPHNEGLVGHSGISD